MLVEVGITVTLVNGWEISGVDEEDKATVLEDESVWLINIFVELLNEGVCVGFEILEFWYDSVNGKEVELEASVGVGMELLYNSGSLISVLFIVAVVLEIWLVLALNEFDV